MREQLSQQINEKEKKAHANGKNDGKPSGLGSFGWTSPSSKGAVSSEKKSKEEKIILEAMANRINLYAQEIGKLKTENEGLQKKVNELEQSVRAKKILLAEIVAQTYQKQGPSLQETLDVFEKNELLTLKGFQSKNVNEMQELLEVLSHLRFVLLNASHSK